jgi:hypothetical protein
MQHSFYAGMGGFAVDMKTDRDELVLTPESPRLTLTAQGVMFLIKCGVVLPEVSKESILDRSKADNLAKTLACLQAGYMIVECVSRLATGLPLSFLEINTLGHAVCALIMYAFWLQKPQDVRDPTLISCIPMQGHMAYMWMSSALSQAYDGKKGELSRLEYHYLQNEDSGRAQPRGLRDLPMLDDRCDTPGATATGSLGDIEITRPHDYGRFEARTVSGENGCRQPWADIPLPNMRSNPGRKTLVIIREGQTLGDTKLGPQNAESFNVSHSRKVRKEIEKTHGIHRAFLAIKFHRPAEIPLDLAAVTRWELASAFITKHQEVVVQQTDTVRNTWKFRAGLHLVLDEVPNWPHSAGLVKQSGYFIWIAICLAIGLYGGLHAAAWNSHFPTQFEQWAWKISAVNIAASGALAAIYVAINGLPTKDGGSFIKNFYVVNFGSHAKSTFFGDAFLTLVLAIPFVVGIALVPLLCIGFLVYIPARIFLVVEAFISLRSMPLDVYQTPEWTQWIPHL